MSEMNREGVLNEFRLIAEGGGVGAKEARDVLHDVSQQVILTHVLAATLEELRGWIRRQAVLERRR